MMKPKPSPSQVCCHRSMSWLARPSQGGFRGSHLSTCHNPLRTRVSCCNPLRTKVSCCNPLRTRVSFCDPLEDLSERGPTRPRQPGWQQRQPPSGPPGPLRTPEDLRRTPGPLRNSKPCPQGTIPAEGMRGSPPPATAWSKPKSNGGQ